MLRSTLHFLSESPWMRRTVTEAPLARRMAERFVAGGSLDEAVLAARTLNDAGLAVSLDYLGELVTSREEALSATDMAIRTLERIAAEGIDGNISVKPSQLGLEVEESFCLDNLARILERARELGNGTGEIFVRIDMESSAYTERTIRLVEQLRERGYLNVGTVVQSALRRTDDDLDRLIELGTRVRLVKGAYKEPPAVAFQDKGEVDAAFVRQMERLLEHGSYPAIATHDESIIVQTRRFAFEFGIPRDSFEFQFLYGIRRDLQQRLREEGYHVRIYLPFGESWYPYLMRRLAERPANVMFVASNVARETSGNGVGRPLALGAGVAAGILATRAWRERRLDRQ